MNRILNIPSPIENELPSSYSHRIGLYYSSIKSEKKKEFAQYFTTLKIANFMADLYTNEEKEILSIADPGAGTGILGISLCEHIVNNHLRVHKIYLTVYEIDNEIIEMLTLALKYLNKWAQKKGIYVDFQIVQSDFILSNKEAFKNHELFMYETINQFDIIISNPPYFKISKTDIRSRIAGDFIHGQPNIYMIFMAASAMLLKEGGQLIYITPRSFTAGPYFKQFREKFFNMMRPIHIHLFGSRKDAFNRDEVLQENIILVAKKEKLDYKEDKVSISYSQGVSDLNNTYRTVPLIETIDIKSKNKVIRIPLSIEDDKIINLVHTWRNTLESLGICISTGPVVAFRSSEHIVGYENSDTYPLLWIQNVKKMKVTWPLINNKKQYIKGINKKLLIANQNLILLRRFSAKEETSRLTAAPFFKNQIDTDFIGIENHLNYIYKKSGDLSEQMVVGLACILNSKILDTYFRTSNGNTQVSATELRDMPFPSQDLIEKLGEYILNNNLISENSDLIINNYIKI